MKRIFTLAAVIGFSAGLVFAEQKTLIDFSKLVADSEDGQNIHTVMDYSRTGVGAGLTAEQRAQLRSSLALERWVVELASSSRTVANLKNSEVRQAVSKATHLDGADGDTVNVMGVRVHFPVEPFNSWALIKPAFEIPAFDYGTATADGVTYPSDEEVNFADPTRFEDGYGVIKNVATIKSLQVRVYGLNFPHHLSIVLENDKGEQKVIPMPGALNFEGWQSLKWDNPAYIQDVRARSLRVYPTYPVNPGFVKFVGFLVQRDASNVGGDFVAYFKDIELVYDKAELEDEQDIDNEGTWHIRRDREANRTDNTTKRFAETQLLRYIEGQKQATESFDSAQ